jgi:hypothetical protein
VVVVKKGWFRILMLRRVVLSVPKHGDTQVIIESEVETLETG